MGRRRGLAPKHTRAAALLLIAVFAAAERLLLVALHPVLFAGHPWWVLGLSPSFAQALAAAALAVGAAALYAGAWQLSWLALLDALVAGVLVSVSVASLSPLWQLPVRPAEHLLLAAGALAGALLALVRRGPAGTSAWSGLLLAGMSTLMVELSLHLPAMSEPLVAGLYTPLQAWAVVTLLASFALWCATPLHLTKGNRDI